MSWGKFALYVGIGYLIYYAITILLEMSRSRKGTPGNEDDEVFDLSNLIDEKEQKVQSIQRSDDLQSFQKKNE